MDGWVWKGWKAGAILRIRAAIPWFFHGEGRKWEAERRGSPLPPFFYPLIPATRVAKFRPWTGKRFFYPISASGRRRTDLRSVFFFVSSSFSSFYVFRVAFWERKLKELGNDCFLLDFFFVSGWRRSRDAIYLLLVLLLVSSYDFFDVFDVTFSVSLRKGIERIWNGAICLLLLSLFLLLIFFFYFLFFLWFLCLSFLVVGLTEKGIGRSWNGKWLSSWFYSILGGRIDLSSSSSLWFLLLIFFFYVFRVVFWERKLRELENDIFMSFFFNRFEEKN